VIWEVVSSIQKNSSSTRKKRGILDHGAYYAQKTQLDAHGNRILWGWIARKTPRSGIQRRGLGRLHGLPRLLSIGADNDLEMRVLPQPTRSAQKFRSSATAFCFVGAHRRAQPCNSIMSAAKLAWKTKTTS